MCLHYHFHIYNHVLHDLIAVEFISVIRFSGHILSCDVIQKKINEFNAFPNAHSESASSTPCLRTPWLAIAQIFDVIVSKN